MPAGYAAEWIIVGLGNPGQGYSRHRHNLGFMIVDSLVEEARRSWRSNRKKSLVSEIELENTKVLLVKPQTYMNLSGEAVTPIVAARMNQRQKLIVLQDDLDLIEGRVRIKVGGGDGGHKGVRSIADSLQFKGFVRMRLGIGRPPPGTTPEKFVLTSFGPEDAEVMRNLIIKGGLALRLILRNGVERAQNMLHSENSLASSDS